MPRQARQESGSGIYHIMIRGVDRQVIFRDDEDRTRFLNMLKETKAVSGFRLHAFCLMPNHVHLLLEQGWVTIAPFNAKMTDMPEYERLKGIQF